MKMRIGYWLITKEGVKAQVVLGKSTAIDTDWSEISIKVPAGKGYIGMVTVGVSGADCDAVCYVGSIRAYKKDPKPAPPENVKYRLSATNQGELSWKADPSVLMYYIYRDSEFIGRIKSGDNAISEPIKYNIQNSSGSYSINPMSRSGKFLNNPLKQPHGGGGGDKPRIVFRILLVVIALAITSFAIYAGSSPLRTADKVSYGVTAVLGIALACSPLVGVLSKHSSRAINLRNLCV